MKCRKFISACALIAASIGLGAATPAFAGACEGVSSCTVNGITYSEQGGPSGDGLTFLASFSAKNQSNSTIATDVLQFLTADGINGVLYLGRQDGSGLIDGDKVSTSSSDGGLTGKWTFSPGTTSDIGAYVAIHAGDGKFEELFQINDPGLSGSWATLDGHGLSNFDLFGQDPPPPNTNIPATTGVPEPLTLSLFGAGVVGTTALRRRKRTKA